MSITLAPPPAGAPGAGAAMITVWALMVFLQFTPSNICSSNTCTIPRRGREWRDPLEHMFHPGRLFTYP